MSGTLRAFREAAAASPRMFWLDGGGARRQPGSAVRAVLGVLRPEDVSLSFDAAAGVVTRHQHDRTTEVGDDIFTVLEQELGHDAGDPDVSWVGYLGYACRRDLPGRTALGVPDAVWMRVRNPLAAPATPSGTSYEVVPRATGSHDVREGEAGEGEEEDVPEWYAEAFDRVQSELHAGNSYEVNLTYRESTEQVLDPVTAYERLRASNPAPYAGYLQHHGVHLLSSSPERFATIDRHRTIEAKPIKGTTPRGTTPEEDDRQRLRLATDPRLRAENLMITDLLRNDLAMVCEVGSVTVPSLMEVESYPAVHQLVSTVRGRLRPDVSTVAALRTIFPAGSMTGAPKRRTMQIIDAVEATPRGVYAGAFGWVSADGRADLSVVIRSLVATGPATGLPAGAVPSTGSSTRYELGTGGGITVRSTAAEEYAETRWKAARVRAALR